MAIGSEKKHRDKFLSMVICQSTNYHLLHIWDGRYAAFWSQWFEGDHCIAVAEHCIDDKTGWPFAFLSKDMNEVRDYINHNELEMARDIYFINQNLLSKK